MPFDTWVTTAAPLRYVFPVVAVRRGEHGAVGLPLAIFRPTDRWSGFCAGARHERNYEQGLQREFGFASRHSRKMTTAKENF
jgi:hypothetical protein